MLEAFRGLDITDPKFYIPVIVGVIVLYIIIKVAKNLFKFALALAVIALVLLVYFNMPSFKVEGDIATLSVKGQEYTVNIKDMKIEPEEVDGKQRIYLYSEGKKVAELPFSKEFAKKFIMDKVADQLKESANSN
jgi:hypothetical protein